MYRGWTPLKPCRPPSPQEGSAAAPHLLPLLGLQAAVALKPEWEPGRGKEKALSKQRQLSCKAEWFRYIEGENTSVSAAWKVTVIRFGFSFKNFILVSCPSHLFPSEIYLILLEESKLLIKMGVISASAAEALLHFSCPFYSAAFPSKTLHFSCLLLIKTQVRTAC